MTLEELRSRDDWVRAVIVFTEDSFEYPYSEVERSYVVGRYNRFFQKGKISNSLYGDCLDGTDDGVRLDIYMSRG